VLNHRSRAATTLPALSHPPRNLGIQVGDTHETSEAEGTAENRSPAAAASALGGHTVA